VGAEAIAWTEAKWNRMALAAWGDNPHLALLGTDKAHRLPIFSFIVRDGAGNMVNEQVFTRMLSDIYGIQARGGCACAGPYGHRLLGIGRAQSDQLRAEILGGNEIRKPGFVRLNFSYMMDEETVRYILESVAELAGATGKYMAHYQDQTGERTAA
jgi:selenocysteine lyase/cysteine desulfurase